MAMQEYSSLKELSRALLSNVDIIRAAWQAIRAVCDHHAPNEKLERAIALLKERYCSPDEFRKAVACSTFQTSDGIDKQVLFHFAGKWSDYERNKEAVCNGACGTANRISEVLVVQHKSEKLLTKEEYEEYKRRKKQGKK